MSDKKFMKKVSVVLEGTSFDEDGSITLTSQLDGVRIEKETYQGRGDIILTLQELRGIVESIEDNFNQRDDT